MSMRASASHCPSVMNRYLAEVWSPTIKGHAPQPAGVNLHDCFVCLLPGLFADRRMWLPTGMSFFSVGISTSKAALVLL